MFVYILASKPNGTLYIGVTKDLIRRVWEHKSSLIDGFTKQYDIKQLVHYEHYEGAISAIAREKQLKAWKRAWKVNLIMESNMQWRDLYDGLVGGECADPCLRRDDEGK